MRYVAASMVTDRQTHTYTHTQTTITFAHVPRVNEYKVGMYTGILVLTRE